MADEARREKAIRELVAQASALRKHIVDHCDARSLLDIDQLHHDWWPLHIVGRFDEALEEARHLGVVPW